MKEQGIFLPGIGNARELGGYPIGDRRIRHNILLRTSSLDQASPEVIRLLQEQYRLQAVVDFRMSNEQQKKPDPGVPGAELVHLPVLEMEDLTGEADPEQLAFYREHSEDRMALFQMVYEGGWISDQFYLQFLLDPRGKEAYRGFFEVLMRREEGRAVLWHCTDGKDRAGCAAMLILSMLGADRELILRDYLLTNEYNSGVLNAIRERVSAAGMPEDKLDLLLFMSGGVQAKYMDQAIDGLIGNYGSVKGYLEQELGVDREMQRQLCEGMLE